jgi:8-amino-7-oxononanoate synthase
MLDRMANELSTLRAADQLRGMANPSGIQLGSNDYLGLSTHPRLKSAIIRALEEDERYCSTGSRLLTGNHERWDRLESEFAGFIGADAALYFPTGYAANIGLLTSVLHEGDIVLSDAANHASLIDGIRLSRARRIIVPHLDLDYLERELRQASSQAGEKFIVVERIFSMDGDRAPLPELIGLCQRHGAWLIIDEAHSTGVNEPIKRPDCVLATVHTCGKALASMGAFVAGSRTLRDFLINRARTFIFTTGLPPYCAAHVHESMVLAAASEDRRKHLAELAGYLRNNMQALGFNTGQSDSQIIPLVLGSNETVLRFASVLTAAGFSVSAIRPPTVPVGTSRIRISLNANLSFTEIDRFLNALIAARETEVVHG